MRMRWRELLFAHWSVDPSVIRRLIPPGLDLDLFEGRCYVGAVPFLMENVTPRLVPPLPGLHSFPELNLRTYVTCGDKAGGRKPGVWFFSLDAGQKLAVRVARRFFHLPYFDAQFDIQLSSGAVEYSAVRIHKNAPAARFSVNYAPVGPVYRAAAGTLDAWLTERYCLYAADRHQTVYRGEIDHQPWPLQKAEAQVQCNTLGEWLRIGMRNGPETLHFAKSLDVHAWTIERI
jgi:uncharacterized protein